MSTVRVTWEGHPSPFDDPAVVNAIARGSMPVGLAMRLRRFEHHERISRTLGHSEYVIGPEHGFSRTYTFGPWVFEIDMDAADWDRIQANRWDRWMFRDVLNHPVRRSPGRDGWREIIEAFDELAKSGAGLR